MVDDIARLKSLNPLQDILHECGFDLERDEERGVLKDRAGSGLVVSIKTQRFVANGEGGDVIDFLQWKFGWTFHQTLQYLENRANLSDGEKKAFKELSDTPPMLAQQQQLEPDEFLEQARRNPFVKRALGELGWDYPGGLDVVLQNRNWVRIYTESGWMPGELIPVLGILAEAHCGFCGGDLSKWQRAGQAYRVICLGDDGFVRHEAQVFCVECVGKFRRWREALEIIARYIRSEEDENEKKFE